MAGKKTLKHWQNFYNTIQDLQIKCSLRNDIITPEIAKYFEQTFFEGKFYWIAAKAMTEIEHKTELGLKGIAIDCKAFDLRFIEIKNKNKELLQAEGNIVWETGLREDGQLFSGLRTSEKSVNYAYCTYTNIESTFYNFYNRFKEITGLSSDEITQIKKTTMLEPITEEKLKEYGFDDIMIERLKTWEDYECKMTNGTDFICASNITGIIYTGEHGYDRFHNIGIDRFKTFDSMFDTAYTMETFTIEHKPGLSNSLKAAIYKVERRIYEGQFQEWLHKFKGLKRLTDERHYEQYDKQYTELLTKNNFLEFLTYKHNKEIEQKSRHEADRESWQIKGKEPEKKESKAGTPRRKIVKDRISKYGFLSYLSDHKKLNAEKISEIENLLCTEELPYCIALLNGLEYLEYFKKEYCNGKAVQRDKLLAELFDTTARRIKGNINVLNPNSSEDRTNYTSYQYKESIDKLIKGR